MRCFGWIVALVVVVGCGAVAETPDARSESIAGDGESVDLPAPMTVGELTLEEALASRRSVREFAARSLTELELSQLLWATQGITSESGKRTAPSAGALYPLEIYVATAEGHYRYVSREHTLAVLGATDVRDRLAEVAGQEMVGEAAAVVVITAVYARTAEKYGDRSVRYVTLEAGHAAQNLLLQATALGLGAVPVGAFVDGEVRSVLDLPTDHEPLYLIPVGEPA